MKDLGFIDRVWFDLDEADGPQVVIGGLTLIEGDPPATDDLRASAAERLSDLPALRRRIVLPTGLGQPRWEEVEADLDYHVRDVEVAAPGGLAELEALVARLMGTPLDRSRPLWEMLVVRGMPAGRWATVTRLHHSIADGQGAVALLGGFLDLRPDGGPTLNQLIAQQAQRAAATREAAAAEGSSGPAVLDRLLAVGRQQADLSLTALRKAASTPPDVAVREALAQAVAAGGAAQQRLQAAGQETAARVRGTVATSTSFRPGPATSLTGPLSHTRRWTTTTVSIADVKTVRRALGGTLNDVVLAIVAWGHRAVLVGRGDDPAAAPVATMVPVSTRQESDLAESNQVSALLVTLPVGLDDPVAMLGQVSRLMDDLKLGGGAGQAASLMDVYSRVPSNVTGMAVRAVSPLTRFWCDSLTTNVPGPQFPLYVAGGRVTASYPIIPIGMNVRITTGIFSYDGDLFIASSGDGDGVPDLRTLVDGFDEGMRKLLAAAAAKTG